MKNNSDPFIIKYFDFDKVKLLDQNNTFHNSIPIRDAKRMADDAKLDLVCFNRPKGDDLAFCKIVDYGKWKYSNEKNQKKNNKEHKKGTKEIRVSAVIGEHDIEHKIKQAIEFIEDGNDVLFSMKLKGRQRLHFQEAQEKMDHIVSLCGGHGQETNRKNANNVITVRVTKINPKQKEIEDET